LTFPSLGYHLHDPLQGLKIKNPLQTESGFLI
jgi:hypothetical protein